MSRTIQKAVRMPCHPKFLQEVRRVLEEALSEAEISRRQRDLIILAVDEAVSSVVTYARFKGYDHDISLEIDINDVRFKAVLNDTLNVFDLNGGMSDEQLAAAIKQEKIYTMSVFLMRAIMDEITYTYKKGFENQLELVHFLKK